MSCRRFLPVRCFSNLRCPGVRFGVLCAVLALSPPGAFRAHAQAVPEGEEFFFVPPGFKDPGRPVETTDPEAPRLRIRVKDRGTGGPTFCRIAVVGPTGQFHQPPRNYLSEYALTGDWPAPGAWGNRKEKAPFRYLGRFFYAWGETTVAVPAGRVRVEVQKGFEYRPVVRELTVAAGESPVVELELDPVASVASQGWYSGDPHLHLPRNTARDDEVILDLLEAEDVRFGSILGYNEPAGPYSGFMEKLATPQQRGMGAKSIRSRDAYHLMSGQEYRNTTYGHILLFGRDGLVFPGKDFNADHWPVYGVVARETLDQGGYAAYAHGGYRQEVYADVALGCLSGIELLQFGIYREIGLEDWYHMLNCGYRIPALGASDWPACRFLADCRTYVQLPAGEANFEGWLKGMAAGRSFVTTGPMLLATVGGGGPGDVLELEAGEQTLPVRIELASEVAPVEQVDIVVNGQVVQSFPVPARIVGGDAWQRLEAKITLRESAWVAVRAWSKTPGGQPNAEAHTNPVYVNFAGRRAYSATSLDQWVLRIDGQIERHTQRDFADKARVLDYFNEARQQLLKIREEDGLRSDDDPARRSRGYFDRLADSGLKANAAEGEPTDEELAAYLRPVPPLEPAEAVRAFETLPGFEVQVVASEPLVVDPVAAAFDADGNLFVCEMRDYPYRPAAGQSPLGTLRLLRDSDGDGRFDKATVFADQLLWSAGVAPWRKGVYVAAPPDIWYLEDTDGDDRADLRRRVFTGFGTNNQQGMLNNLVVGADMKIYGSTAPNGGQIRHVDRPQEAPVDIVGRDFRFDPETEVFESISGTVQFGNTFDDFGNRFTCSESQPLLQVVLPQHYLARNPHLPVPSAVKNLAPGPVAIHRISPIERWRQIRSARRVTTGERGAGAPGASHHVVDAAAGVQVYRGGSWPAEFYGTVFVGDGQNNLIHHRTLVPEGPTFGSQRVEQQTEFLRSSDIWFRPVNLLNSPDGNLYCLDMSREVLESIHVPLDVARHLDFTSGRDRGRIYRIAPAGFKPPPPPRLSQATTAELVAHLGSPHGWYRDTAARLLYERQDRAAVAPLELLVRSTKSPATRVASLWTLHNLKALRSELLALGLRDPVPGVRLNSLRLAEPLLAKVAPLRALVLSMGSDVDPQVRLQLAFTLGEVDDAKAADLLARLFKAHGADPWMKTALFSSASNLAGPTLSQLLKEREWGASGEAAGILESLALLIGARGRAPEIGSTLAQLAQLDDSGRQQALVAAVSRGLRKSGQRIDLAELPDPVGRALLQTTMRGALQAAADASVAEPARLQAIGLLATAPWGYSGVVLSERVVPQEPPAVQLAAVRAIGEYADTGLDELLLGRFPQVTAEVQQEIVATLLRRPDRTLALLQSIGQGSVPAGVIDATQRQLLLAHRQERMAQLAQQVLGGAAAGERQAIVRDYQTKVMALQGNAEQGSKVFDRVCATCHQVAGRGHAIGPNLAASAGRETQTLIQHLFDPNQVVLPNYLLYTVLDTRGQTHSGMIASQTATSLSLRREKETVVTLLRSEIEELNSTGKSLMPEGLEKDLTPQDVSDLAAWLQGQSESPVAVDARKQRDKGTLAGTLVEPAEERKPAAPPPRK